MILSPLKVDVEGKLHVDEVGADVIAAKVNFAW